MIDLVTVVYDEKCRQISRPKERDPHLTCMEGCWSSILTKLLKSSTSSILWHWMCYNFLMVRTIFNSLRVYYHSLPANR